MLPADLVRLILAPGRSQGGGVEGRTGAGAEPPGRRVRGAVQRRRDRRDPLGDATPERPPVDLLHRSPRGTQGTRRAARGPRSLLGPDVECWVAGTGPDTAASGSATPTTDGSCGSAGSPRPRSSSPDAWASVFCAPSLHGESFGVVLAEAMAAGTAVVASALDGYRNVATDDVDSVLVPPGDADAALGGALSRTARRRHPPEPPVRGRGAPRRRARDVDPGRALPGDLPSWSRVGTCPRRRVADDESPVGRPAAT
jgi:hypothetical protein